MDGVLIDTEPVWRRVEREVFARVGVELTDEQLRATWGLRIDDLVAHWYSARRWDGVRPRAVQQAIVNGMVAFVRGEGEPLPGAVEAVTMAHQSGLRVGIASSSSRSLIDAVIERLGIGDRITAVCTADDEQQGKPHPAVYLSAARLLNVEPSECVAVEDSPFGVLSATRAGMLCVAVRTDAVEEESIEQAHATIDSLVEFTPQLIARLASTDVDVSGRRFTA